MAGGQRFIAVDLLGLGPNLVQLIHGAASGVLFYTHGINRNKGGVNHIQDHQDHQSQLNARKQGQSGNSLGHAYSKALCTASPIACGHRTKEDTQRGQRVEAHGKADGQQHRQEGQELLIVAGESGAQCENQHTAGNHKNLPPTHPSHQGPHACSDGAGFIHHTEGATDNKQEGDDAAAALNTGRNGLEQLKNASGILIDQLEGCGVYHGAAGIRIFNPSKGTSWNNIAGQGADQNNTNDDDHWVGCVHLLQGLSILSMGRDGFAGRSRRFFTHTCTSLL